MLHVGLPKSDKTGVLRPVEHMLIGCDLGLELVDT